MSNWYQYDRNADGELVVTFLRHPHRRFPPAVLRDLQLPVSPKDTVTLTGPTAVWMYFHVACWAAGHGAGRIEVVNPDGSRVRVFPLPAAPEFEWCRFSADAVTSEQVVEFSGARISPTMLTALPLRSDLPLRITGAGSVWMYAAVGAQAAELPAAFLDSPREAELISVGLHRSGTTLPRQKAVDDVGVILGIVGDPNSGKSVLTKGLFEVLRLQIDRSWAFDCDAASPTPNWYLSLLNSQAISPEDVRDLREDYKVAWSPELEASVGSQLVTLKHNLALTVADLPGGRHPGVGEEFPPDRIPKTRTVMFTPIDLFVVLGREDRPESLVAWRQALEERGCGGRVIAELISAEPEAQPELSFLENAGLTLRGRVCGLERKHGFENIARCLQSLGVELLNRIRWWQLAVHARGAVARAFLTGEKGVRYGAAAVTATGSTFLSGQYSSFNHVTNVHAEQSVLAAAAAAGSADVTALAVASSEPGVVARPCGVCRQVMQEHAARTQRDFMVVMVDSQGRLERCELSPVSELLPLPWQSHRQSARHAEDRRQGCPATERYAGNELQPGTHLLLPSNALGLVWDGGFPEGVLVKVKYRSVADGLWEKLPHAFSEGRRYQVALEQLRLATPTFCGARAAVVPTDQLRLWVPSPLVRESKLPNCLRNSLSDAGIPASRWYYTGSRALGLSRPGSDHDLVVQATGEQIRRFRSLCVAALERGQLTFPANSGTWTVLDRVFPGGRPAVVQQQRFLETLAEDGQSFSLMFVPVTQEPLLAEGWTQRGWCSLCGQVVQDNDAVYKRSRFVVQALDGRQVEVVSYHKLANLVKTGDMLALAGWLSVNSHRPATYRLYQFTAAIDTLVWLDASPC